VRFAPGHGARGLGKGGHWEEVVEGVDGALAQAG